MLMRIAAVLLFALLAVGSCESPPPTFGVVVLAHARPGSLARSLASLRASSSSFSSSSSSSSAAAGGASWWSSRVVVSVDATWADADVHASVVAAARAGGVADGNVAVVRVPGEARRSPSAHLAAVYRAALDEAFVARRWPHAVLLEDDLVVAPDFVAYFAAGQAALRRDASLFCVSAWADRGFLATARDESVVLRGEHFMGLGWMLSREAYLRLLAPLWPPDSFFDANPHHNASGQEWDDFVRKALLVHSSQRDAPLECAFPEVPRTRHTLDPGAAYSTSADTQARWFDQMRLAERTDSPLGAAFEALSPVTLYDGRLARRLSRAVPLRRLAEAALHRGRDLLYVCGDCGVTGRLSAGDAPDGWERVLSESLDLHAHGVDRIVRGVHRGVVATRLFGNALYVAAADSPLLRLRAHRDGPLERSAAGPLFSRGAPALFAHDIETPTTTTDSPTRCNDACLAAGRGPCDDERLVAAATLLCGMHQACARCDATDDPALHAILHRPPDACTVPRLASASCQAPVPAGTLCVCSIT